MMADRDAVHGLFDMSALNSCVTDSAAASSSWGSGSRVLCTWLNVLPDGTKLTTLAQVAKSAGKKMGVVTTATVTHATPAGFIARCDKRGDETVVSKQYMELADVVMGGGMTMTDKALDAKLREIHFYALAGGDVEKAAAVARHEVLLQHDPVPRVEPAVTVPAWIGAALAPQAANGAEADVVGHVAGEHALGD
jgi:hypothetical protein